MHTELQKQVIEEARKRLKTQHNLDKVCIDLLRSDLEITNAGMEDAVDAIYFDTLLWDGLLYNNGRRT